MILGQPLEYVSEQCSVNHDKDLVSVNKGDVEGNLWQIFTMVHDAGEHKDVIRC